MIYRTESIYKRIKEPTEIISDEMFYNLLNSTNEEECITDGDKQYAEKNKKRSN